ncbi:hypothetical protein BBD42_26095 [Paenibacillus sp. BIHB 4019]|uniref:Uncharacterized protein n=1 Tax=Paenibacillus sp. BIHB 4019 TaxID=1870819 RepID=A0A1B2DPD5_9BACL|nr:hypothetical protein [Paenibacillus sp. BIHB 4019]ANY69573.1 hypothetical protein BBD42_26095 [Paenibacillus sp. BIHB 4019]
MNQQENMPNSPLHKREGDPLALTKSEVIMQPDITAQLSGTWKKLAFWIKMTAALTMLFGLFQTIASLLQFGLGTIAGLLEISIAVVLFLLGKQVGKLAGHSDENAMLKLAQRLLLYFRLQAAFIVTFAIVFMIIAVTVIHFLVDWDWAINLMQHGRKMNKLLSRLESLYNIVTGWFS